MQRRASYDPDPFLPQQARPDILYSSYSPLLPQTEESLPAKNLLGPAQQARPRAPLQSDTGAWNELLQAEAEADVRCEQWFISIYKHKKEDGASISLSLCSRPLLGWPQADFLRATSFQCCGSMAL